MIQFTHVLCPTDFSEFSLRAFDHAVGVARRSGGRITLLHVFPSRPVLDVPPLTLTPTDREQILGELRRLAARAADSVPIECDVVESPSVHQEILCQARRRTADLIVLGSHGRSGFDRFLLGSVTERLLRHAPCPVLVVPRRAADADVGEPVRIRRVLYPTDFSPGAQRALGYARWIATDPAARLTLLHVIEVPPELRVRQSTEGLDVPQIRAAAEAEALARLRTLVPADALHEGAVDTCVQEGAAHREILAVATAQQADVIVMGIQGRSAVDLAMFGSNTARVARGATCPVLVVPPQ
jgi:nucleotide-binding universal stress UspA family protein